MLLGIGKLHAVVNGLAVSQTAAAQLGASTSTAIRHCDTKFRTRSALPPPLATVRGASAEQPPSPLRRTPPTTAPPPSHKPTGPP
jgi:hypothetical protein